MPDHPLNDPSSWEFNGEVGLPFEAEDHTHELLSAKARAGACPPLDLLFAAEEDVLPATAGGSIREHLARCSLCQIILTELDPANIPFASAASARIRAKIESRTGASSLSSGLSGRRSLLAFAAALILGVVGFFAYRLLHTSPAQQPPVASLHSPAAHPIADIAELHHVSPLPPPDNVPALVTRGASPVHGPFIRDLLPAFRAYNRGDFAQAASAFASLVARFPQSEIPSLYLGVSELELNQNANAQHALQQALRLSSASQHDATEWYLAVADLRLAQPQAAAPLLHQLCSEPRDPYAPRACTLAQQVHPS